MNIYLNWLTLFCTLALAILHSTRCLTIIQQKNYKSEKNSKTIRKEKTLFFIFCFSAGLILAFLAYFKLWLPTATLILIITLFLAGWLANINKNAKLPLKYTNRAIRLAIAYYIVLIGVLYLIFILAKSVYVVFLSFILLALNTVLLNVVNVLVSLFENLNNQKYIKKATLQLAASPIYKIGITGSYGKTSVKNILAQMLAQKYKVLSTPENYNTPLGICRTLQGQNLNNFDIFIAEMGARYKGDIKELAQIVRPNASIITGIAPQHLATFKSIENIVKEKGELAQATLEYCVFDADNPYSKDIIKRSSCKSGTVSISDNTGAQVFAKNIRFDNNTTYFDIEFIDKTRIANCATLLLGAHNITNILLAATLAKFLGVEAAALKKAIASLAPVPHRLQLAPNSRGITIIDDTYNANLEGVKSAYKALELFEGRKVVFAQGIADAGKLSAKINIEVGKLLAEVADIVMLTGSNSTYIEQGLLQNGFNASRIYRYASFKEAKENFSKVLAKGDVFLLQNDLIDIS